jgi:hypothetical protein
VPSPIDSVSTVQTQPSTLYIDFTYLEPPLTAFGIHFGYNVTHECNQNIENDDSCEDQKNNTERISGRDAIPSVVSVTVTCEKIVCILERRKDVVKIRCVVAIDQKFLISRAVDLEGSPKHNDHCVCKRNHDQLQHKEERTNMTTDLNDGCNHDT